ncbi:MAG: iron-containing alcohol dehydrogenase [Anaerolineales bacterium]
MWYFVAPQIIFGEDALEALEEVEGERALVITDRTLVRLGLVDKVVGHLKKAGFEVQVFDEVEPDPSLQTAHRGAELAQTFGPDWIVAVGGGSPMDAAKAVWILYERPDLDPAEINPFVELGLRKKARLITVPTTSGTGAEVTWAIVLTDTAEQRKLGLGNRENVADIAIVDPALVMGMPPALTADTGMDALTHAVEGYSSTWHNDMTDGLCLQATQVIFDYLPRAVADGDDAEAREKMHNAATLAGLGFGNSMASMAHAVGHSLGAVFHVPHGRAVGLLLPYTIEFIAAEAPERFAKLARLLQCHAGESDEEAARALARAIRELAEVTGSPTHLAALEIPPEAFEERLEDLVDRAFNDSSLLTAARSPGFDELRALFTYAYEGRPIDF